MEGSVCVGGWGVGHRWRGVTLNVSLAYVTQCEETLLEKILSVILDFF